MAGSIYDWSTTAASNANADGDVNWQEFQDPDTVNNSARQMMARVAEKMRDKWATRASTGGANVYAVTIQSAPTAPVDGMTVGFFPHQVNTGDCYLAVNSFGNIPLRPLPSVAHVAGEIQIDVPVLASYRASSNEWISRTGTGYWVNKLGPSLFQSNTFGLKVGDVKLSLSTTADAGFIRLTDSTQSLAKASYPDLNSWASGQGYPWGSTSTHFTIPAAGGYFLRFGSAGSGVDPDGPRTGGTYQTDAIKSHSVTVSITDPGHSHSYQTAPNTGTEGGAAGSATRNLNGSGSTGSSTTGITATGSYSGSTETRPKNVAMYADMLYSPALVATDLIGVGGLAYKYSSTTAAADPGAGYFRLNNATIASATELYISETDVNGAGLAGVLAGITSGSKLLLTKVGAPGNVIALTLSSGASDNGAWDTYTISAASSTGTISSGDHVSILVMLASGGGGGSPGGSNTQIQYNNTGNFGGSGNLTFSGSTLTVGAAGSALGHVALAGSTSGTTTLQPAATASGTLTLPAATDTLVGKATTDTLTNKTFTGAVNPSANDAAALGQTGTAWSDLYLASGAVIDFNSSDVTLTHSANALAFSGGTVSFDATPTVSGTALRKANDSVYNIVDYGAIGDDSTDNTAAIQAALDAIKTAGGGTLYIPVGTFRSGPLTYDISATASTTSKRLRIRGAQKAASIIKMVSNAGTLFTYTGNSGSYQVGYLEIDGVKFVGDNTASSVGIYVNSGAFSSFHNLVCDAFDTCFKMIDVDQADFTGCTFRNGNMGMKINIGTPATTGPNSLVFTNVNWSNNAVYGLEIDNPQAVTFIGGSIQYNGTTVGSSSNWGIKLKDATGSGYSTVSFIGTIFEGNTGQADVWCSDYSADFVTTNFIGCSWYRTIVSAVNRYSTNCVRMDGSSSLTRYTFKGNTFFSGGGYTPSAGRPCLAQINANAKIYSDGSDYFADSAEAPNFAGYLHLPTTSGISWEFGDALLRMTSTNNMQLSGALWEATYGAAANTPPLLLTNTTDAAANTGLIIQSDRATPAANDECALSVKLSSSTGVQREMGRLIVRGTTVTNAAETATLEFQAISAGTLAARMQMTPAALNPASSGGLTLGTSALPWGAAYLGSIELGAASDTTITRSSAGVIAVEGSNVVTDSNFGAWTTYTPTITSGSGTPTSVSAAGAYKTINKMMHITVTVTITTVGTAAGTVIIPLPSGTFARDQVVTAMEWQTTNAGGAGYCASGGSNIAAIRADGTTFWASSRKVTVSGVIELT